MSYTITNNIMYVRDDTGNLVPVSMIASDANEAISAINTVAENAKNEIDNKVNDANTAIESKTDEQVARIPEVTTLAEDVNGLKGDKLDKTPSTWPTWTADEKAQARENIEAASEAYVNELKGDLAQLEDGLSTNTKKSYPTWKAGAISNVTGNIDTTNQNWRYTDIITLNHGDVLFCSDITTKMVYVHTYVNGVWQNSKRFDVAFGSANTQITVSSGMTIRFCIERTDVSNLIYTVTSYGYKRIDDLEMEIAKIGETLDGMNTKKTVVFDNLIYDAESAYIPQTNEYSNRSGTLGINIGIAVNSYLTKLEKSIISVVIETTTSASSVNVKVDIFDQTTNKNAISVGNIDTKNGETISINTVADLSILDTTHVLRLRYLPTLEAEYTYKFIVKSVSIVPVSGYTMHNKSILDGFSTFKKTFALDVDSQVVDGNALKNGTVGQYKLVSVLKGKKINALGDSFTNTDASNKQSYLWRIASRTGAIVRNYGVNGSEVMEVPVSTIPSFQERWEAMDNDADIVIVFGGINDCGRLKSKPDQCSLGTIDSTDTNTFYGAYKTLLSNLIDKYPRAVILSVIPPILQNVDNDSYGVIEFMPSVRKAIMDVCLLYGIPTCDLYGRSGISNKQSQIDIYHKADTNIHLNNDGINRMSRLIQRELEMLCVDETLAFDVDYLPVNTGGVSVD